MLASEQTKLLQAESCSVCHTPFHRYYILRPDDYRMELQLFPFSLERGDECPNSWVVGSQQGEDGQDGRGRTTMILTRKDHPRLIDKT